MTWMTKGVSRINEKCNVNRDTASDQSASPQMLSVSKDLTTFFRS